MYTFLRLLLISLFSMHMAPVHELLAANALALQRVVNAVRMVRDRVYSSPATDSSTAFLLPTIGTTVDLVKVKWALPMYRFHRFHHYRRFFLCPKAKPIVSVVGTGTIVYDARNHCGVVHDKAATPVHGGASPCCRFSLVTKLFPHQSPQPESATFRRLRRDLHWTSSRWSRSYSTVFVRRSSDSRAF